MTANRHGSEVVEFPDDLTVTIHRDFDAPAQLVFDAFTQNEYVRRTIAPYGEEVKYCNFDLRVGGEYRYIFVTDDGLEMCFHGIFHEIDPPHRMVETWSYDGWPDVEALETIEFREHDGVTSLSWTLRFADEAGRARMGKFDGIAANFDNVEDLLRALQESSPA